MVPNPEAGKGHTVPKDAVCIAKKAWKTEEQPFPLTRAWPREEQDLSMYLNFSMCLTVVLNGDPLEL